MKTKQDPIQHDRRKHSVMLDRSRHDMLSRISPRSVAGFAWVYAEMEKVNAIRPGIGDFIIDDLDNILQLSPSVKGWRADALTEILKGDQEEHEALSRDIEVPRGLRGQ